MFLSKFPRRYKQCMWPHSNDDTPEAKTLIVSPYYGLVDIIPLSSHKMLDVRHLLIDTLAKHVWSECWPELV